MQTNSKISIILPTYNGEKNIIRSIQSVQNQTFSEWELIIVIDGSTDATFERVSRIAKNDDRIIIVHNVQNQGIQKTLNDGLRKSQGKYIARIDDDDIWFDERKLQKQYDFLENNSDHVLVGTGVILVDEKGNEMSSYLLPETDEQIRKKILEQNCFVHSSVMFQKKVVDIVGGYSEDRKYKHLEDYEFWLRMGTVGKFANIPIYSVAYQVSTASISGKNKLIQLRRSIKLSWEFRNKYSSFFKNFIIVNIRFIFYFFMGRIFDKYPKVRAIVTSLYKS